MSGHNPICHQRRTSSREGAGGGGSRGRGGTRPPTRSGALLVTIVTCVARRRSCGGLEQGPDKAAVVVAGWFGLVLAYAVSGHNVFFNIGSALIGL